MTIWLDSRLELVNFDRDVKHLNEPLDRWFYFLNNGEKLDTDALPTFLNTPELRQAMEVLKMYSQDEMARELYEGRLKRARDERCTSRQPSRHGLSWPKRKKC